MKKRLLAMLLALCMFTLCTATALAAPEKITPTPAESKTYNVEYTTTEGASNAGKQYVLLIVKAPKGVALGTETALGELDVDSILYIDQAGADDQGKVTFTGLQLKSHTSANVYISGETLNAPVHIGYIEVAGVTVDGSVKFHGNYSPATVRLLDAASGAEVIAPVQTDVSGAYTLETVPAGDYWVEVTKPGYCKVTKQNVSIEDDTPLSAIDITGYAGDINGSNKVNGADLSILLNNFNGSTENLSNTAADINGSGKVDGTDLGYLIACFNQGDDANESGVVIP